jgi:hypothetical protein
MKLQHLLLAALLVVMTTYAQDEDSSLITYQGKLVRGGHLVSTNLPMTFAIYDAQDGGQVLFSEDQLVAVVDGFYSVKFGVNPTSGDIDDAAMASTAYLQVTVDGEVMKPREKFVPPPFAKKATERWNLISSFRTIGDYPASFLNLVRIALTFGISGAGDISLFPPASRRVQVTSARIKLLSHGQVQTIWGTNGYFSLEVRDCSSGVVGGILRAASQKLYRPANWTLDTWVDFSLSSNKLDRIVQPDEYLALKAYETNDLQGVLMIDVRVK